MLIVNHELDRLVDEIVKRVRDKLLERGLKPDAALRSEVERAISAPDRKATLDPPDLKKLMENGAARVSTSSETHHHSPKELASFIDHTLLKPDATEADVRKLCAEAVKYRFATVCLNSSFIPLAAELLKGSSVKPIAVVGFPLGAATTASKAFEAREAIKSGAQEIDMVINIGALKSADYDVVLEDIRAVVVASNPFPLKVILETAALTYEEKVIACALSKAAGAAFVKTSTGFGAGGATAEDIALMRKVVGPEMGVKASGGIRTTEDAERMIEAGATRIGASASVAIVSAPAGTKAAASGSGGAGKSRKPFTGLPYKAGPDTGGKKSGGGGY